MMAAFWRSCMASKHVLIGNTFPLTLVRGHRVTVEEIAPERFRAETVGAEVCSFWGHANSRAEAAAVAGVDLVPREERPVVTLDGAGYPVLDGRRFQACYVLSPDRAGAMVRSGEEIPAEAIAAWHFLKLSWLD